ncbi:hypothetical protein GCM10027059_48360 [Myceligenerans halotolerans]
MTRTPTDPTSRQARVLDGLTPDEVADLVRDARALVAGVEKGITRIGVVFALAVAATIAAMKANWHMIAEVTALVAVVAFAGVLLGVAFRITLGDPPEPLDDASRRGVEAAPGRPADPRPAAPNGSGKPATGSGPATARNRMIPRK